MIRILCFRNDAEYYDKVKDPIDFTRINQRLRAYEYNSFNDFCQDVELVISNAQSYYSKETPEYLNATELQKVYQELKQRGGDPTSPSESAEPSPSPVSAAEKAVPSAAGGPDESKLEHIVALILSFTDKQGRLLSPPFRVLVSREELPDYYEVIEKRKHFDNRKAQFLRFTFQQSISKPLPSKFAVVNIKHGRPLTKIFSCL